MYSTQTEHITVGKNTLPIRYPGETFGEENYNQEKKDWAIANANIFTCCNDVL